MGKKRRIISSPRKYARKHRGFLDQMDGVLDGKLGRVAPFIKNATVTDLGNQTVGISVILDGNIDYTNGRVLWYLNAGDESWQNREFSAFIDAVEAGKEGEMHAALAAQSIAVITAGYQSAASGRTISID